MFAVFREDKSVRKQIDFDDGLNRPNCLQLEY